MPLHSDRHPLLKGYRILHRIGQGSYSVVYKAVKEDSGEEVAIKCVSKTDLSPSGRNNIVNEIQIMKMLKNEFILNLKDFQYDDKFVYLILDYCDGGDLSSFLKSKRKIPEDKCKTFMQQLVLGLKFLRSKNITHFDLKPQNLLLMMKPTCNLKIGDFGLSGFLSDEARTNVLKGSPLYMAPEILLGRSSDPKADLWSVGVIFYECLFGKAPLAHLSCRQLVQILMKEKPIKIPHGLTASAADLLSRLLVIKPSERISFEDLFAHPFLDLEHYPSEESYLKAVNLARSAVKLDFEKNYMEAFNMYCSALSYLVPFLHTPLTPEKDEFVQKKVLEYFRRAEQLKSILYKAKEYVGRDEYVSRVLCEHQSAAIKLSPALTMHPGDLQSDSILVNQPLRTHAKLALNQLGSEDTGVADVRESSCVENIDMKALRAMCSSTPKIRDAIDIGLTAQMYLYDGNYQMALENYKMSLNMVVPLMENEPPSVRRALLKKLTKEWLKEAESSRTLIAALEGTNSIPFGEREGIYQKSQANLRFPHTLCDSEFMV